MHCLSLCTVNLPQMIDLMRFAGVKPVFLSVNLLQPFSDILASIRRCSGHLRRLALARKVVALR
jgi:hypothetical protein